MPDLWFLTLGFLGFALLFLGAGAISGAFKLIKFSMLCKQVFWVLFILAVASVLSMEVSGITGK